MVRDRKHILVSITFKDVLHWRLMAARRNGKEWEVSSEAFRQFQLDIGCRGFRQDGGIIVK